jgi:amine acid ABC transporter, permease protein, 3-TM region, His/Glu/Gln/Arg/opine family
MPEFNLEKVVHYLIKIIPFVSVTIIYVLAALLIGIVFGFFFAAAKLGKNKVLKFLAYAYTAILRSIPSIVLIFLVYYGVPEIVKRISHTDISRANRLIFIVITLGLYSIASVSEIMRSSYQAINKGQYEAAISNGMSELQSFRRIVLPQAFLVAIPNLGNTIISLMKEGSLGFTIGLVDIMGRATLLNAETYSNNILEIYFSLAAIYWGMSVALERLFSYLEHRFSITYRIQGLKDQQEQGEEDIVCS